MARNASANTVRTYGVQRPKLMQPKNASIFRYSFDRPGEDWFESELRDVIPEAEYRSREIDRDDPPRVPQRNGLGLPRKRGEIPRKALSRVRYHQVRVSVRFPDRCPA